PRPVPAPHYPPDIAPTAANPPAWPASPQFRSQTKQAQPPAPVQPPSVPIPHSPPGKSPQAPQPSRSLSSPLSFRSTLPANLPPDSSRAQPLAETSLQPNPAAGRTRFHPNPAKP